MLNHGFSLLEACVTIFLLSILVYLAYSTNKNIIIHTYRIEARVALYELAYDLEQYHADNLSYEDYILNINKSSKNHYQLLIINATKNKFTIAAVPNINNLWSDLECPRLTINQDGIKGDSNQCW